jgi:hypothetical protein
MSLLQAVGLQNFVNEVRTESYRVNVILVHIGVIKHSVPHAAYL